MTLPLDGVRVLDLTRLLPGNYATLLLADLGADVVKVEEPGQGDYIRWVPPLVGGEGAIHRALNRNKRSVTLNLKHQDGAATLRRLAATADALIESFRPGVMARLGVGYDVLASDNPRIVYCAITGYGQDGPYRDRAGHDINYIGYAGLLHATGSAEGDPVIPAVPIGDLSGGMAAAFGTVSALLDARASDRGRLVDVSMFDVVSSWLGVPLSSYLATGDVPHRGRMRLSGGWACYRVYRTADGKHLGVGAIEPQFWFTLCEALGASDIATEQWSPRQDEIAERLQEIFERRSRDEWLTELSHLEACVGPVNDIAEAMRDPQFEHRGLLASVGGEPVGPGAAIKLVGTPPPEPAAAPALGEHTVEILEGAGYSADEITEMRTRGVV